MSTGAEGQARVQQKVCRLRIGCLMPAGNNPQALAKPQGLEVIHTGPLPVLVLHQGDIDFRQRLLGLLVPGVADVGANPVNVLVGIEQAGHPGIAPKGRGTRVRLKDGLVGGIFHGDGVGPHLHEKIFQLIRVVRIGRNLQLDPGHVSPASAFRGSGW